MGVTGLIIFQEGESYPLPLQISIIQYKTLRSVIFVVYIIPYFLYEVIFSLQEDKRKRKKQHFVLSAQPGIDPGPKV